MCGFIKLSFKTLNLEIRLFNLTLIIMLAIQLSVTYGPLEFRGRGRPPEWPYA
jgi:hypothetical protein